MPRAPRNNASSRRGVAAAPEEHAQPAPRSRDARIAEFEAAYARVPESEFELAEVRALALASLASLGLDDVR